MDDHRLLRYIESAVELDELESEVCGRSSLREQARPRLRRRPRVLHVLAAAGALSAFGLVLLWTSPKLRLTEFAVEPARLRDGSDEVNVRVAASRPAYIRLVVIDERGERWIMPLGDAGDFLFELREPVRLSFGVWPNPADRRGPSRGLFVMAIGTLDVQPSAADVLSVIPDPIVPAPAGSEELERELTRLSLMLNQRWRAVVEWRKLP